MLELLALGAIAVAVLAGFGILWAVAALVCWLVFLPFKLLGLAFKGLALALTLPFLILLGIVMAVAIGVPLMLVALFPLLPFVLAAVGVVWLSKRLVRGAAPAP